MISNWSVITVMSVQPGTNIFALYSPQAMANASSVGA